MRAVAGLVLLLIAAAAQAHAETTTAPAGKLSDDAAPLGYSLNLKIDPHERRFGGDVNIRVKLSKPSDHLWLHGNDLQVGTVGVIDAHGQASVATYRQASKDGVAEITFAAPLPAQTIELDLAYSAPFSTILEGLYKVKVGNDEYVITQMEPISARRAFPGFDEPRFKVPFDITLTVPKHLVAVANTLPKHETLSSDGEWKTIVYNTTRPLPTYLVAFAVGPWDVVDAAAIPANDVRHTPVPLRGIGPRGTGEQLRWILRQAPAIVKYYEDYTQQAYPFDKLDLLGAPDFAAGAMENAGLIVFRDALLRLDAHSSADLYRASFDVTAHEIAHQWFGDLVTVPWWDDIWLNEAYATWAQGKATVALKPEYFGELGRLEGSMGAMNSDSLLSARKIRQPIQGRGDIETAFDSITYQKGAAVLRMFEEWIGEDTYRKAMRAYLARHAFGSGSSDDLIAIIAELSGKGEVLAHAMRSLLDQPGIPLLHTQASCKAGKQTLEVTQSRYLPFGVLSNDSSHWEVPMCVRFGHADASGKQCFLVDKQQQTFAIDGGCADWYMPNADATGYYRFTMSDEDFALLGKRVGNLAPPEQLIYSDAISSAFRRGEVAPATVLEAMPALAGSGVPQVATALIGRFEWIREHLSTPATRPALDAFATALYAPRLNKLGYRRVAGESIADTNLRKRSVEFLALTLRDPDVRKPLLEQGKAALGLDGSGTLDLGRADPDLVEYALAVAVQDIGAPAFEAIMTNLKSNHDTEQRYHLLSALGSTRDAKLGERARDFGLTDAVAVGEMREIYDANNDQPENRGAFWEWFKAHFDALLARMPPFAQSKLPATANAARCNDTQAMEIRDFFAPRVKDMIGGERGLAQTVEAINQCNSLREHVGEKSLSKWAEAHPAR